MIDSPVKLDIQEFKISVKEVYLYIHILRSTSNWCRQSQWYFFANTIICLMIVSVRN